MRCTSKRADPGPGRRSSCGCWNAITWISCAPARRLKGEARDRLAAIAQRLAVLGTQFSQNVLGDEEDWILTLTEAQMAGVPAALRDAAAAKARELKLACALAVTLSRSSVEPFLQFADDRALREQLYRAWTARGDNDNAHNNSAIITEMLALRAERATLLGYENFAAFKLANSMAGTPQKARALLEEVWEPARRRALEERDALAGADRARRRQFPPGALGLALLRRKTAAGKI